MDSLEKIWGSGEELSPLQMSIRALVMFIIALILIRFGGMRIFGKKSALDNIIVIMLGAVMARGIVGASPFVATVAASAVLVVINRVLARLCVDHAVLNRLIKGRELLLFKDGNILWHNMKKCNLSESDLMESLRLEANQLTFDGVEQAFLETNGRISFIMKPGV